MGRFESLQDPRRAAVVVVTYAKTLDSQVVWGDVTWLGGFQGVPGTPLDNSKREDRAFPGILLNRKELFKDLLNRHHT